MCRSAARIRGIGARAEGRLGLQDLQHPPGRRRALHARVELGGDRAQRQERLGCQQQHQQRGLVPHVPVEQPQPDLDRDQGRGDGGGELEHQRGQERDPQRGHGRRPVGAGGLADHLLLRLGPAEQLERGQALDHVEEVPGERGEQPPLPPRLRLGVPADQHREQRDQRQRRRDQDGGDPVGRCHPRQNRDRDRGREHQLRKVTGEIGIESVKAPGGQRGDLCALPARAARPGRAEPDRPARERAPQLRLHGGGRAQRADLAAVGHRDPHGHDAEQRRQGAPQRRGDGLTASRGGERVRQQARLGEDRGGGDDPEDDGGDQLAAGGPGVAQQPGVNRAHGQPA